MDARQATRAVLQAGMSGEIAAAFQCVSEATTSSGETKFSDKVCRALARSIVCRTYAAPVFQLCHLINAADACGAGGDGYQRLFFATGRAAARNFRAHFEAAVDSAGWRRPGFALSQNGVAIRYSDAVFNLPYSRMPLLGAMMEFLIAAGSYTEIDDVFAGMLAEPSSQTAIGRAANALQRHLYRYLDDHLPTVQERNRYHRILEFLAGRSDHGEIEIDDEAILEFWRHHSDKSGEDGGDFRTYRTAFEAFLDLIRTLELSASQRAAEYAVPIGGDRDAGEIDVAVEALLEQPGEWQSPLHALGTPPASEIKLLNKSETAYLALLCECGPLSAKLPLSLMRAECFGKAQSRLTQGLRRRVAREELIDLAACPGAETYGERERGYADAQGRIRRVLKAAGYVLLRHCAGPAGGNVVALRGDDPADLFGQAMTHEFDLSRADLEPPIDEARRTFRAISRKGFEEDGLEDADTVEGFRQGAGALMAIDELLDSFLGLLGRFGGTDRDLEHRFDADREIFRRQFLRLYGEHG